MYKWLRIPILVFLASVTFFTFDAQASAKTELVPKRGEGAAGISGYVITNVHYQLAKDPSKLGSVEFNLDGPASQVAIGFDVPADQLFTCHNVSGQHWLCEVHGVEIALINKLSVIASD